ncbi:fibronectin type III domain-containing protein [Enterococcus faecalis]
MTPGAPTIRVVANSGAVNYTITDPEGATDITGYKLSYKLTIQLKQRSTKEVTAKTGVIDSLANGSEYQFKAQAKNANGYGDFSEVVTATPTEQQ